MTDYATPQPMPEAGKTEVTQIVLADLYARNVKSDLLALITQDIHQRAAYGLKKYKVPLQTHNGRDALTDAYQELLDACHYFAQWLAEYEDGAISISDRDAKLIEAMYNATWMNVVLLREALADRDNTTGKTFMPNYEKSTYKEQ